MNKVCVASDLETLCCVTENHDLFVRLPSWPKGKTYFFYFYLVTIFFFIIVKHKCTSWFYLCTHVCVFPSTPAWHPAPALAVLLWSDPGGCQETAVLRRGYSAQTSGHSKQNQKSSGQRRHYKWTLAGMCYVVAYNLSLICCSVRAVQDFFVLFSKNTPVVSNWGPAYWKQCRVHEWIFC